jgi:hypothetical protein
VAIAIPVISVPGIVPGPVVWPVTKGIPVGIVSPAKTEAPVWISGVNADAPVPWIVGVPVKIRKEGIIIPPAPVKGRMKPPYTGSIVIVIRVIIIIIVDNH